MNIQKFIESGQLDAFVLGMLPSDEAKEVAALIDQYPALRMEADAIESALRQYGAAVNTDDKQKLFEAIDLLEMDATSLQKKQLPKIHKYSDAKAWFQTVEHLVPNVNESNPLVQQIIHEDEQLCLYLVTTIQDVLQETHENEKESFLILQGSCTCYIGENVISLSAGGFVDIPMLTNHHVIVHPGQPVVAILQHLKIAI